MTFVNVMQNTGGFMSVIVVIAFVMIQYFQLTIYYTSMVKSMFLYQPER